MKKSNMRYTGPGTKQEEETTEGAEVSTETATEQGGDVEGSGSPVD